MEEPTCLILFLVQFLFSVQAHGTIKYDQSIQYINLDPFITQWRDCFVQVIFYNIVDISSSTVPVVVFQLGYNPYEDHTLCSLKGAELRQTAGFTVTYQAALCSYVLQNYMIKGIRCLSLVSLYPNVAAEEEQDMYKYLNTMWSRADMQEFSFRRVTNKTQKETENEEVEQVKHWVFPPFFPTRIYLSVVITEENYEKRVKWGPDHKSYNYAVLERIFLCYVYVPIITVVPKISSRDKIEVTVALSLPKDVYAIEYMETLRSSVGLNLNRVRQTIATFMKNHITLYIHSQFGDPPKPFEQIYYPGLNISQDYILAYMTAGFNVSVMFDVGNSIDDGLAAVAILPNIWGVEISLKPFQQQYIGSDTLFIAVADVNRAAVTCSGLKLQGGFYDYIQPFTWATWFGLGSLALLPCFLLFILPQHTHLKDILPFTIVSILCEESFDISATKYKVASFTQVFAIFALTGIVLSNGYKGTITTSVIKPFDETGIDSLEAAVNLGYTSVTERFERYPVHCCDRPDQLETVVKPLLPLWIREHPVVESKMSDTCGSYVVYDSRLSFIDDIPQGTESQVQLYNELLNAPSLQTFDESIVPDKKGRSLLKLAKQTIPLPCNSTVDFEIASCDQILYIDSADLLNRIMIADSFDQERSFHPKFYILEDKTRLLKTTKWGISLRPLHANRDMFSRHLMAYVESGVSDKIDEIWKEIDWKRWIEDYRIRYGNLEDQTKIPKKLDIYSKMRVLFVIYALAVCVTIVSCVLERALFATSSGWDDRVILLVNQRELEIKRFNANYPYLR